MKFFTWILSFFGLQSEEQKLLASPSENAEDAVVEEKKDRTAEIVNASQDFIKKIYDLSKLAKGTIYYDKFVIVSEATQKIHDKILSEEKVPIERLEQFHMYYTENFIETYTEALADLLPKKEIDVTLKSSYKLNQELEEERKKKEQLSIINNVHSLGIKDRIELLISYINPAWKLVQDKEYHDVIQKEQLRGVNTTYGDKYTTYLINHWKLSNSVKFIGELNVKETPIVYDIETLEVYKILFDSTYPEKIGDITDETIKDILQKNFKKKQF
ncbi:MAG: hypothetical protein RLZZ546_1372 [Bacteroidota bacterium]|jgi:hypothetical protein